MKNLIFIGVDQLRHDVVGPYNTTPSQTPKLDYLISNGVTFTRAYTSCPLCSPARASMLTGDYAFRHGMGTNCDMYQALGTELTEPDRLLHKDLIRAGYNCGFVGKWHVGVEKSPSDYGFLSDAPAGYGNLARTDEFKDYLEKKGLDYTVEPTLFFNPVRQTMSAGRWRGPVESTTCYYQTDQAIAFLDQCAGSDQPFFLSLQYWDPHGPHLIPDEFWQITDRSKIRVWESFDDDLSSKPARVKRERDDFYRLHPRSEEELIEYIGLYCDHVALLDSQIGRLLEHLKEAGLTQDTLIVFTSDHGDMTGAHGGLIDKGLPYEEAMRVPLVFSNPSLQPKRLPNLALTMDVLPTALGLMNVESQPRQASDLSAIIRGEKTDGREYLLAEYHGLRYLFSQRILVSDDNWKYIFSPGDYDELYNLNEDPHEMQNLVDAEAAQSKLSTMREALMIETARFDDPLRDCVSKFNGQWRTNSGQFDATSGILSVRGV